MLTIGTRGSDLALWQAHHVSELLGSCTPLSAEIRVIRTEGDRVQDRRLSELGTVGVFTKEIEDALLAGQVDLAVHSFKDLPTESPAGLEVAAVPARGPVRDCLLIRPEAYVADRGESGAPRGGTAAAGRGSGAEDGTADRGEAGDRAGEVPLPLRYGAWVGTGSARRRAQLRAARSDLRFGDLRGNIPTRLARLTDPPPGSPGLDGIVVAEAALARLDLDIGPLRIHRLDPTLFVPAPAQGALAVQIRRGAAVPGRDESLAAALAPLHDPETALCVATERQVLAGFAGGCNLPLGVHVQRVGTALHLRAFLGYDDGPPRRAVVVAEDPLRGAEVALARLQA